MHTIYPHAHTHTEDILRKFQYKSLLILISSGEVSWIGIGFAYFSGTRKEVSWECATTTYALQQPTDFMSGTH